MGYLRDRVRGCRRAAAVADHGGGEIALRGMVMSLGGEIATPPNVARSGPSAEGIEKQAAIAALHHRVAQARQPHGPIAKIVGFPAALRYAAGAEESLGDVTVARLLEPAIERSQCEHQAF